MKTLILGIIIMLFLLISFVIAGTFFGDDIAANNVTVTYWKYGADWDNDITNQMYYSYGYQVNIKDQNENAYHKFEDVVNISYINGKIIMNITNYYVDRNREQTMYMIMQPYIIDKDLRKINLIDISRTYPTIKQKMIINTPRGIFIFYPELSGIPTTSVSDVVTSPLKVFGYDVIETNMQREVDDKDLKFSKVIYLNTYDLNANRFDFTTTTDGLIIDISDKVKLDGTLTIDPQLELSLANSGYLEKSNTGVYTRYSTFGYVGRMTTPTPTPTDPPD